jgi:hypothetical protein
MGDREPTKLDYVNTGAGSQAASAASDSYSNYRLGGLCIDVRDGFIRDIDHQGRP